MSPRTPAVRSLFLLVAGLAVVLPGVLLGFNTNGGFLGITTSGDGYQRDLRVLGNFEPDESDNAVPNVNYPGALGADLSVWKSAVAWDSHNPRAGKNFDFDWQGSSSGAASDTNVLAVSLFQCGGGTLAFTETPTTNGWRIFFCPERDWWDGPGAATVSSGKFDIQGVAAHELGHTLGLDHTENSHCAGSCSSWATMCAVICGTGWSQRSIEADDVAGLASLYGEIPAFKPLIEGLDGSTNIGGTLVIQGQRMGHPTDVVRVKFSAGTSKDTGVIPGVVEVSPVNANRIDVRIPAEARDGNVLVWKPLAPFRRLSNAFPIDIRPARPAACSGTTYGVATPGNGGDPAIELQNGPSVSGNEFTEVRGSNLPADTSGWALASFTRDELSLRGGTVLHVGFPLWVLQPVVTDAAGVVSLVLPIESHPCFVGFHVYAQYVVPDTGAVGGLAATPGLDVEVCAPDS